MDCKEAMFICVLLKFLKYVQCLVEKGAEKVPFFSTDGGKV